MKDITKLYAAYKAGYMGDNILNTYFSFFANMILEEKIKLIEATDIAAHFEKRYSISLPLSFVNQVLGIGVHNKCIVEDHGKYSVNIETLEKFRFDSAGFNKLWERLVDGFKAYCSGIEIEVDLTDAGNFILDILDESDEIIISNDKISENEGMKPEEYAWYSFVKSEAEKESDLYSFIAALSASNITKQAIFFAGDEHPDYSDLHVYLDSPIIFALLGMDEESRTESYKVLVQDMKQAGCNVHILDHNFHEVEGILYRAAGWATSTEYDIRKANNAARYFHDSGMNDMDIAQFCADVEAELNDMGITVVETDYDVYQQEFQEDESVLYEMVKQKYSEHGYYLSQEKQESIRIDVRSIVMIYRKRQGQTAVRLDSAKQLMLTSNNAIANVSKKYESNKSINSGHIPACISADLFGAILWLNSPMKMMAYQKQKLLADCYGFLQPDHNLVDKYIQSLDEARNSGKIDEKTFLFLRTHKVVLDSLMDITKGDYARFTTSTYLEVYEDIQAKAYKKYREEADAHEATRKEKSELEENSSRQNAEYEQEIEALKKQLDQLTERTLERKVSAIGWASTLVLFGVPYLGIYIFSEIMKSRFSDFSYRSVLCAGFFIMLIIIDGKLFDRGKRFCFRKVRDILEKQQLID